MPRYSDNEIEQIFRDTDARTRQRVGPAAVKPWLADKDGNQEAHIDGFGNIQNGVPQLKPQADPFPDRLQTPVQDAKQWAQTADGKKAIAEDAEARRPKPRLWQASDERWCFRTRAGEAVWNVSRQGLLEGLVFGGRSKAEITEEIKEFLDKNPDYVPDAGTYDQLLEALAMREDFLTASTLTKAWRELKPSTHRRARELASSVTQAMQEAADREKYFDTLPLSEVEEAINAVARARRAGLI